MDIKLVFYNQFLCQVTMQDVFVFYQFNFKWK